MFSFEFNKLAGAILGSCVFAMALGIAADGIYANGKPEKPGYDLPEAKVESAAEKPVAAVPLPVLLAKADVTKGQADTKVCQACHNFEKGAGVKVGPPLYGVVDRSKGSVAGFDYSANLKAKGGAWTFGDLDQFLANPKGYITGTKMGYGGEASPEKRADILAYLRSLSDTPAPLPAVTEAAKPAEAAKAAAPAKPAEAAAPPPPAKPEKTKPQGLLAPVETGTKLAAVTSDSMPEPYHGADPYYPEQASAAGPASSPGVASASSGIPEPYHGVDPQYPDQKTASVADTPAPISYAFAESSPPMPYKSVDPVYPDEMHATTAIPAQSPFHFAESSPPMPYHGADPFYTAELTGSLPVAASGYKAPTNSPPEPYLGADPQYPGK